MLLNETQKQQRTIAAQAQTLAQQNVRIELLERELQTINAFRGAK